MESYIDIKEMQPSLISYDVKFVFDKMTAFEVLALRKKHKQITQMVWIKKEPIVDPWGELYNPSALILLMLN